MAIDTQRIHRYVHGTDTSDSPFSRLPLRRFGKDETELVVRFISDPVDNPYWLEVWTVWREGKPVLTIEATDKNAVFLPPRDDEAYQVSTKVLANAMEVEEGTLVVLEMPISLAKQLFSRYEMKGTLTDRDFSLMRMGKGLNTTYGVSPESPEPRKAQLARLQPVDLEEWAAESLTIPTDWPFQPTSRKRGQEPPAQEDDDELVPETDTEALYTLDDLKGLPLKELRRMVVEEYGVDPEEVQKWSANACREFLTGGSF